jgi:MoxR-like ATPase
MPGPLWWAFNRATAFRHSSAEAEPGPEQLYPDARAVVLLDEIDKADPDVPNNLLVPLGSLQFLVEETGELVKTTPEMAPLVFITTNNERELPTAFLRRCVEIILPDATDQRLMQIGVPLAVIVLRVRRGYRVTLTRAARGQYCGTWRGCCGSKAKH